MKINLLMQQNETEAETVNLQHFSFVNFSFQHWREMPNYAILVDIRDRPSSQITYVPEENIEIITNTKVCAS